MLRALNRRGDAMWTERTDYDATEERRRYEAIKSEFPGIVTVKFECLVGWHPLLRDFFAAVRSVVPEGQEAAAWRLLQVKEKFGGLRVYYALDLEQQADETIREAYMRASDEAERTCDICGQPGRLLNRRGRWMTRCLEHAEGGVPVPHAPSHEVSG